MFLIVGAAIGDKQHYHAYFLSAALVNIAWLMAVIGWISAARCGTRFCGGPPLAFARGARGRARRDGARRRRRRRRASDSRVRVEGWHGPDAAAECRPDVPDDFPSARLSERIGEKVAFQKGANVAASMAAPGVFSPGGRTPGGRTPGGRAARRASNGVAASSRSVRPERSGPEEEVSEVSLAPAPAPAPAARALLFGGECARRERRRRRRTPPRRRGWRLRPRARRLERGGREPQRLRLRDLRSRAWMRCGWKRRRARCAARALLEERRRRNERRTRRGRRRTARPSRNRGGETAKPASNGGPGRPRGASQAACSAGRGSSCRHPSPSARLRDSGNASSRFSLP